VKIIDELTDIKYRNGVKEETTMYCPQCATPNAGDVKFCRSCGIELEAVALVLNGRSVQSTDVSSKSESQTAQNLLEKHSKGVRSIIEGTVLLAVSLLIGVALALFVPSNVPWIFVWMVFFGWMAVWGGIELADGIGALLESKSRLRLMKLAGKESAIYSTPQKLLSVDEPPTFTHSPTAVKTSSRLSVTEGTTRQLNDLVEK
jgi:hypothetical protein